MDAQSQAPWAGGYVFKNKIRPKRNEKKYYLQILEKDLAMMAKKEKTCWQKRVNQVSSPHAIFKTINK